jgi:NAD(P)-dependent dehydrogenase (short-subunit alcohol dehydrogenase family)
MKKELLIFGSEGALGRGISSTLVEKDYDSVILFDFKFHEPTNTEKIKKVIIKDMSVEQNVIEAFSEIKPDRSKKFFLFSSIGGFAGGSEIWDKDFNEWKRMFDINLMTNVLIAKHFSKLIIKSHSGAACFTAAYSVFQNETGKAAYGASKSALVHLIKSLAHEGEKINLSVNGIAPFIIDTPSNRDWMVDADFSRWMKPNEIGELVHKLFECYNFVSGNVITLKNRFEI